NSTPSRWVVALPAAAEVRTDVADKLNKHRPNRFDEEVDLENETEDDTAEIPSEAPEEPEEIGPFAKYFGRYGTFALVGLAQSTLLTLGLIFFVKLEPAHPFLLVLAGWVSSC